MAAPKFKVPNSNSLRRELRKRTNAYFKEVGAAPTGNAKLYSKAIFVVVAYISIYCYLVFFNQDKGIPSMILCAVLGTLTAAIGFNVMHDGAHGSFSNKKWINELAGMSLNFLGANVFMWKTKHNTVHHTYTNIEGVDDDLNARPLLRLAPDQKRYGIHKFQHLYFLGVYAILYMYWVFVTDYKKYFSGKVGSIPLPKMSVKEHLIFWFFKAFHLVTKIILPIQLLGWKAWLVGFVIYGVVAGIVMSLTFQLAHVVEDASFPTVDEETGTTEDEWVVHQLKTTANFSPKSRIVNWFTGGLNYQVEHHLFPNIAHVHYPAISKIVKELCDEHKVPYVQYPSVFSAISSHVRLLKQLGKA